MSKPMDRRKFLLGSVGAAALGAFVKPAPTPFSEIPEVSTELITLEDWARVIAPKIERWQMEMMQTIYYGNDEFVPTQFTGFKPRVECG